MESHYNSNLKVDPELKHPNDSLTSILQLSPIHSQNHHPIAHLHLHLAATCSIFPNTATLFCHLLTPFKIFIDYLVAYPYKHQRLLSLLDVLSHHLDQSDKGDGD